MATFSNANTGGKPADPYTAANKDTASLEEKMKALDNFTSYCKFGMMTTRDPVSEKLVSRCMAIASKVRGCQPNYRGATSSPAAGNGRRTRRNTC